ncbi:hypothetical protein [Lysinibacillus boronitolerans]|uniref:hypothetical protein n=1 Tax=Lysinibacillus boronitolerans TaxID=309788 RepID=UPI00030C4572|nr:hypothetical protein [Lysinibacillus boronitolerans]
MKLLLIDRDPTDLAGIKWFLHTYFPGDVFIEMCTSISEVSQSIRQFEPDAILLNIDLFPNNRLAALHRDLQKLSGAILAMTTEPLFKNALKAIDLQVAHLFVKPIDLELLKKKLTAISLRTPQVTEDAQEATNDSFYNQLFLDNKSSSIETTIHFTMIEPEHTETFNKLYNWLQQTPIHFHMKTYPLSNSIVCLFQTNDIRIVEKDVRTLMKEWRVISNSSLNIGIYDGTPTTIKNMYTLTKRALHQSFYEALAISFMRANNMKLSPLTPY